MAITIDPLKSSFEDDFKAKLFLEDYAERIDSLNLLRNTEGDWEKAENEKDQQVKAERDTNFKINDEKLFKSTLDALKRSHEYELYALKNERRWARDPYSNRITEDLAENSKKYLINMAELCKERILFLYTVKNKILTTFNNSFVCFEDKFFDNANKNKVFKLDFCLYHADKIFEGALRFAKNYLKIPLDNDEARRLITGEYRKFMIQLCTIRNEFNGYTERDAGREVPYIGSCEVPECPADFCCSAVSNAFSSYRQVLKIKPEEVKEYRCVPYDIFIEKFRNCKKSASKLIEEISDIIEDLQKKVLKIVSNIDKINGNKEKGKIAIEGIRDAFHKLTFINSYYLKNIYDLCSEIFDSLNKTEIMHRK